MERAARLFGAAWTVREQVEGREQVLWQFDWGQFDWGQVPSNQESDYTRRLNQVRAELDEPTFTAAWAEGQAMTLEQAIADALEGLGS